MLGALGLGVGGAGAGAVGGLGLAGGAFGGAAAANIATIALAFRGLGDALDGDYEAFQKLTPEAQKFVQEMRGFLPFLDKLSEAAGKGVRGGVAEGLNRLLSPEMVQMLPRALGSLGNVLGQEISQTGGFLGSPEMVDRLERFLKNGEGWTRDFAEGVRDLFDAFTTLTDAGAPFIDWVSEGIAAGAEWTRQWADAATASGDFQSSLERGQEFIREFGDFLGSTLGLLKALADVLDGPAMLALGLIGDAFDELAESIERNQDEIAAFIEGGINVLAEAIRILWPLLETALELINGIAEAVGGWEVAFEIILGGILVARMMDLVVAVEALIGAETAGGLLGATAAAEGLAGTLAKLALVGPIAIPIAIQLVSGDDLAGWSNKIGAAIVDALPLPQGWKDALTKQTVVGGHPIDPDTGRPVVPDAGDRDTPTAGGSRAFQWPLPKGVKTRPGGGPAAHAGKGETDWQSRNAVDIMVVAHTPVLSPIDGTVVKQRVRGDNYSQQHNGRWGDQLTIEGDGFSVFITHLYGSERFVEVGDEVRAGDQLGWVANAGGASHIHVGVTDNLGGADNIFGSGGIAAGAKVKGGMRAPGGKSPAAGTPPPFDKNLPGAPKARPSGRDLLTSAERTAMARAERDTPGQTDDDIRIRETVIERLTGLSARRKGEAKANIEEFISDLFGEITRLRQQGWAQIPETKADKVLAEVFGVDESTVQEAGRIADRMVAKIEAEIRARQQQFEDLFRDMARGALDAFDRETRDWVSPTRAQMNAERDARDMANLQEQLADAERALEEARKGREVTTSNAEEQLKKIGELVARYGLANEIGKVQAGVLGIQAVDVYDEDFARTIGAMARGGGTSTTRQVDEGEVRRAEQRVSDIRFNMRQRELARIAKLEEDAHEREREALRANLEKQLQLYQQFYAQKVAMGMAAEKAASLAAFEAWAKVFNPSGAPLSLAPGPQFAGEMAKAAQAAAGGVNRSNLQVEVNVADGMSWLNQFVTTTIKDETGTILATMGAEADRRQRGGAF
jgi:murein DD-endopeptidase MepM/ murein hydrolase activator NlpD